MEQFYFAFSPYLFSYNHPVHICITSYESSVLCVLYEIPLENEFLCINLWFSRVHNFLDDNLILVLTSRRIPNALKLKKKNHAYH